MKPHKDHIGAGGTLAQSLWATIGLYQETCGITNAEALAALAVNAYAIAAVSGSDPKKVRELFDHFYAAAANGESAKRLAELLEGQTGP